MKGIILGLLCFVIGLGVGLGSLWPRFQAVANTAGSLRVQTETLQAAHSALQNKYQELSDDYSQLQSKYQSLKDSYDGLQGENTQLQAAYQSAAKDYKKAKEQLQRANAQLSQTKEQVVKLSEQVESLKDQLIKLEVKYNNLARGLKQSSLRNPTWKELLDFLKEDDTESIRYIPGEFDCSGFAITLRDRSWRRGFRCAFVEVGFGGGQAHALTAFDTPDHGLIYVDDTGNSEGTGKDTIAFVEMGKPYGLISLEGVREEHIDCPSRPEEFWKPLRRVRYDGNLFSYDYYLNWQRRVEFYEESVAAYNKAVKEYNRGSTKYSYSQLDSWRRNLDELEKDLGTRYKPLEAVRNIEIYWN